MINKKFYFLLFLDFNVWRLMKIYEDVVEDDEEMKEEDEEREKKSVVGGLL